MKKKVELALCIVGNECSRCKVILYLMIPSHFIFEYRYTLNHFFLHLLFRLNETQIKPGNSLMLLGISF